MLDRDEVFLFIAYNLEGRGYSVLDLAGATIYGITKRYYPSFYKTLKKVIKSKDKDLLDSTIVLIYSDLFKQYKADLMESPLCYYYFDFAFNAYKHAVEALQQSMNVVVEKNHLIYTPLVVDGDFGPRTEERLKELKLHEKEIYCELKYLRKRFYAQNKQKWFRVGWLNRCNELEHYLYPELLK